MQTGTPQVAGPGVPLSQRIGPLPNLARAVERDLTGTAAWRRVRGRGYTHGEAPPAPTRALVADAQARMVVRRARRRVRVRRRRRAARSRTDCPPGSRLVPTAPAVAKMKPAQRSAPERELARHVQLLLPARTRMRAACLRLVQRLGCGRAAAPAARR